MPEEEEQQGQAEVKGHPAWQEILDVLPDDLHGLVKPTLEKWDKGVQDKFSEIHNQYDPYKKFVENKVDAQFIEQAVNVLQEIENNPQLVVDNIIKSFELQYGPISQVTEPATNDDEDFEFSEDITKHPMFKQMSDQLAELNKKVSSKEEADAEAQAAEAFEKELKALETKHGDFDKLYVTALMANGVEGDEAVKRYTDTVNQAAARIAGQSQNQQVTTPVVMGGDGVTGSGLPDNSVNMGGLKNSEVNQLVLDMLNKANES